MDFDLLLCCDELLIHEDDYIRDGLDEITAHTHDLNVSVVSCIDKSSQLINDGIEIHAYDKENDDANTLEILLEKECDFHPGIDSYLSALQAITANDIYPFPAQLRCRSVHWLLKACIILGFCPLTAALSVNYLDRYLAKNLCFVDSWKPWMFELLSVSCLSIAAKMEEVDVPLLRDLQVDGLEYSFHDATIQRMELAVMSSLGWRLRSITPLAFAEKVICGFNYLSNHAKHMLSERVSELIVGTLSGLEFLQFRPSVIALASIQCAMDESFPIQATYHGVTTCIPANQVDLVKCAGLLDELVVDPITWPSSRGCPDLTLTSVDFDVRKWPPSPTGIIGGTAIVNDELAGEITSTTVTALRTSSSSSSSSRGTGRRSRPTEVMADTLGMDATWAQLGDEDSVEAMSVVDDRGWHAVKQRRTGE